MRKVTKNWTKKDGTKIRICDMEDDHLMNAIRFLERRHAALMVWYATCPGPNGDMAQDCFDREAAALDDGGPEASQPLYRELVQEMQRRGLWDYRERRDYQLRADMAALGTPRSAPS